MKRSTWWTLAICVTATALIALGCSEQTTPNGAGPAAKAPPLAQEVVAAPVAAPQTSAPPNPLPPAAVTAKPAAGTATLVGVVRYNGEPPKRRPVNMGPEKACCDQHKTPPLEETLVVGPDRSIQWVLVRIASKVPGTYPTPTEPAVIDQKGCIFAPHVLAVRPGQTVEVRNSDQVLHNVRCDAVLNQSFNRNLPKGTEALKVSFASPEVGIKVKCDVHFWMGSYVHVVPHPFFAVTGADGAFTIAKVPPGTHRLEAWHEKLGKQAQEVTVKDGEVKAIEFVFQPK